MLSRRPAKISEPKSAARPTVQTRDLWRQPAAASARSSEVALILLVDAFNRLAIRRLPGRLCERADIASARRRNRLTSVRGDVAEHRDVWHPGSAFALATDEF